MQIKINKDIMQYEETVFFGLTLWQFLFCTMACGAAVGCYFLCREAVGLEMVSWLCILSAAPFVAIGFIKYNGMHAGKIVVAIVKAVVLTPKYLVCKPIHIYYYLMTEDMKLEKKERKDKNEQDVKLYSEAGQGTIQDS